MNQKISVISAEDSSYDLGVKQWNCLRSLDEHYTDVDMRKISTTSKFHDDVWDVIGTNTYNFRWGKWFKVEEQYPIMLVCKIVCYSAIQIDNNAISTIKSEVARFINVFQEILSSKSILTARKNQPFNLLSQLNVNDISLVTQNLLVTNNALSHSSFDFLDGISNTRSDAFPNAEFLNLGVSTPWREQDLPPQAWVKQLKESHGLDTTIKSYSPLKFETVSSLVKQATPFIDEHFDTIKGVFDEIEEFHKTTPPTNGGKINLTVGRVIKKKYGEKLNSILPVTVYDSTPSRKGLITQGWYSKLEQLAQGAAGWIILLTTGLRNVDMRNLEKGCCQPSKRHDLLHYLITDIKKTHLQNHVIPVPPKTQKAVTLAEIAKINRGGDFLFSKNHNKSSDTTSKDKRKMNDASAFNKMIQDFASHYDISLETIAKDDKEATAHCVRATLAGYIGANSTAAILILKKLFGHSNALMPDAYLSHNPVVIAERNKNITSSQESLAEDMAQGMVSGRLSGTKGKQMLKGVRYIKTELKNESVTEMDMQVKLKERIKEMLLSRIRENQIYALKTPMSVACIRSCSDSSDTPCAKLPNREKRKESRINKEITDALATLPNPSHCIGKECSDALFGEAWSRDLLVSFDYYIKYLQGVDHQSIDIKNEAELFIKNYGSILKDIYSDEREEGYFD